MVGLKGELVRVGDLCKYTLGYNNGSSVDVWCKLVSIKDEFGNLHSEYYIITGYGERNSKVTFDLKPLVYCKDLSNYEPVFGNIKDIIKDVNPHNVYLYYDRWLSETEDKIEFLLKQKEFILKNKNIIDKIDSIL